MNKKHRSATAIALLATGCAHAQNGAAPPQVQLYGIVDAGVEYVRHVGSGGASVTRMPGLSGGQLPSRWGLRGTDDLGAGLRAVFTLEAGFAVDTGATLQGGRGFGRQSFVGLQGDWGTLTFGRHWTMTFFSMVDADVIGPSVFGLATFDPYLPNARVDESVSYRGTFNGITLGGTYSLGRDGAAPANCSGEARTRECRAWSALLKYDAPRWGVALAQDHLEGGVSGGFFGQPAGTTPSAANTDTRTHLHGYVRVGDAKLGGGLIRRKLKARPTPLDTHLYYIGAVAPIAGAFSVDAQLIAMRDDRPGTNAHTLVVRGNYALSRRTATYAMLGQVRNGRNAAYSVSAGEVVSVAPISGRSQTGFMVGVRHSF